jgi:hypothetical protein
MAWRVHAAHSHTGHAGFMVSAIELVAATFWLLATQLRSGLPSAAGSAGAPASVGLVAGGRHGGLRIGGCGLRGWLGVGVAPAVASSRQAAARA